jgi:hypothetical protein
LYFYCNARKTNNIFWDAYMSTGLAKMRRDGFVSLYAGADEGYLITRKLIFEGEYLFVNLHAPNGTLQVEAIGKDGKIVKGFERKNS